MLFESWVESQFDSLLQEATRAVPELELHFEIVFFFRYPLK